MSYRKSWSKTFTADDFQDPEGTTGRPKPQRCNDGHVNSEGQVVCLEAHYTAPNLAIYGLWKLRSPIIIQSAMPGTNHKVIGVSSRGMHNGSFGSIEYIDDSRLLLYGNGTKIWRSTALSHPHDQWGDNSFDPQLAIDSYSELDVGCRQEVIAGLPSTWVSVHDADIKVDIEYYVDTAPERASVTINVFDQETGKAIKSARTTIKSGATIIADDYTDSQGTVTFQNITVGSYTVRVMADEYNMLENSIEVTAPAVEYDVFMVPIPTEPWPWWTIPVVAGAGLLTFITVVPALARRQPQQQPIILVK